MKINFLIDRLFVSVYFLYLRWRDPDAFYHTAALIGLGFAAVCNIIVASIYFMFGWGVLEFRLFPSGVLSLGVICLIIWYFHNRKESICELKIKFSGNSFCAKYMGMLIIVLSILFIIIAQIIYKSAFEKWSY